MKNKALIVIACILAAAIVFACSVGAVLTFLSLTVTPSAPPVALVSPPIEKPLSVAQPTPLSLPTQKPTDNRNSSQNEIAYLEYVSAWSTDCANSADNLATVFGQADMSASWTTRANQAIDRWGTECINAPVYSRGIPDKFILSENESLAARSDYAQSMKYIRRFLTSYNGDDADQGIFYMSAGTEHIVNAASLLR